MNKLFFFLRLSSLIVLIALATSCKKDNDPGINGNIEGSFEITINGDESYSFQGIASFNQVIFDGGTPASRSSSLSMLCLNDDTDDALTVILSKENLDGFGNGTYTFIEDPEDDEIFLSVTLWSSGSETNYYISAGTVTFSSINDNRLEGSLNVEMISFSGETITVTGEFNARHIGV